MSKKKKVQGEPILYILMRSDLASMNPGKAMAQACHAANGMVDDCRNANILGDMLDQWENSTSQGFGTTIVLDVIDLHNIEEIIDALADDDTISAGIIHDPTYPLKDGKSYHVIPLDTCGWVFCDKTNEHARIALDRYKLFK